MSILLTFACMFLPLFFSTPLLSEENGVSFSPLFKNIYLTTDNHLVPPPIFSVTGVPPNTSSWKIEFYNENTELLDEISGSGTPPQKISWIERSRTTSVSRSIKGNQNIFYKFFSSATADTSIPFQSFFVRKIDLTSFNLPISLLLEDTNLKSQLEPRLNSAGKNPDKTIIVTGQLRPQHSKKILNAITFFRNQLFISSNLKPEQFRIEFQIIDNPHEEIVVLSQQTTELNKSEDRALQEKLSQAFDYLYTQAQKGSFHLALTLNSTSMQIQDKKNKSTASLTVKADNMISAHLTSKGSTRHKLWASLSLRSLEVNSSADAPIENNKMQLLSLSLGFEKRPGLLKKWPIGLGYQEYPFLDVNSSRTELALSKIAVPKLIINCTTPYHLYKRAHLAATFGGDILGSGGKNNVKISYGAALRAAMGWQFPLTSFKYKSSLGGEFTYFATSLGAVYILSVGLSIGAGYLF
ncbi:MAG: hypothetical protein HQK50_13200 [Oligoflexia bacterium]|nr:hypothetical protein [Oligoflexia bacterium]MBF0366523.1 hypothetical protein [Oligoflexia bacterium]